MSRSVRAMIVLPLMAATALAACSAPRVEGAEACPPEDSADYFFPAGALVPSHRALDVAQRHALSLRLKAAGEPPLWCGDTRDGYRVLHLGGHNRDSELVSLRRVAAGWLGTRVTFASPSESDWRSNVYFRTSDQIQSPVNTAYLNLAMAEAGFWRGDPWRVAEGEDAIVFIEARVDGEYRAVTEVAPSEALLKVARLIGDTLPPLVY